MHEPGSPARTAHRTTPRDREGGARAAAEFVVALCLCIILFRTFAAEAYIVPTGSMAPTLLGLHKNVLCTNCGMPFPVGMDEQGRSGRSVCPNCGMDGLDRDEPVASNGDRLLVQKFLYEIRPPRRWEVAVFQSPVEPNQAYVKRVVGLPGESIRIARGDVYADGGIARKSRAQQHAMRIPVFDSAYVPRDSPRYPRWQFRRGPPDRSEPTGWRPAGGGFVHERGGPAPAGIDWVEYLHWSNHKVGYWPVVDFVPYNGGELRGENNVSDLDVEADLSVGPDVRSIELKVARGGDDFQLTLPVGGLAMMTRNGRLLTPTATGAGIAPVARGGRRPARLEMSLIDRRLIVTLDGANLFEPFDFDEVAESSIANARPVALGVRGTGLGVSGLRIYRDVYYTGSLANTPRQGFGIEAPYRLGDGEYFVLGDNSAVSNDSRFWDDSPVVAADRFIGKPFLVHLPGQVVPLQVFGRSVYWVPDPREIRYIR